MRVGPTGTWTNTILALTVAVTTHVSAVGVTPPQAQHTHASIPDNRVNASTIRDNNTLTASASASSTQPPRPLLFGSGYIYPAWKGLAGAAGARWESASLEALTGMGATLTGASFNWVNIEPVRGGGYNWTDTDAQVAAAATKGLTMLAYTGNTPDWALLPNQTGLGYRFPPQPSYTADFQSWVTAVATRYRGRVRMYEFWNEQNGCGWINPGCANGNTASSYAPWLCTWYKAMKAGDPSALLSVGGLDYNQGVANGYQYIEDLYTVGAGDCFDAVALHPYNDGSPGNEIHYAALSDTYAVLVKHGHGHKPLWMNEYGWNSHDEAMKAAAITNVLGALSTNYSYVSAAMYLSLTDLPTTPDTGHGYGLASQDTATQTISPRASYKAFQAFPKPSYT